MNAEDTAVSTESEDIDLTTPLLTAEMAELLAAVEELPRRSERHAKGKTRTLSLPPKRTLLASASTGVVALGLTAVMALTGAGPFGTRADVALTSQAPATPQRPSPRAEPSTAAPQPETAAAQVAPPAPPAPPPAEAPPPAPQSHTVAPGETLAMVGERYGVDWRLLFDANPEVADPGFLHAGWVLVIPPPDAVLERRPLPEKAPPPQQPDAAPPVSVDNDAPAVPSGSVWDQLAQCESGGNWQINTGNGYYGGLQFSLGSWKAVGGSGYPHEHSREEQIRRGEILQSKQGWGAWPACSRKLGLL
jgi:LysM repeat protein